MKSACLNFPMKELLVRLVGTATISLPALQTHCVNSTKKDRPAERGHTLGFSTKCNVLKDRRAAAASGEKKGDFWNLFSLQRFPFCTFEKKGLLQLARGFPFIVQKNWLIMCERRVRVLFLEERIKRLLDSRQTSEAILHWCCKIERVTVRTELFFFFNSPFPLLLFLESEGKRPHSSLFK